MIDSLYSKTNNLILNASYVFSNIDTLGVLEVIKFLKEDYAFLGMYLGEEETHTIEAIERQLVAYNNDLLNFHLVKYCKSENIFYYLLEMNSDLLVQAIHNIGMMKIYDKRLIQYLVVAKSGVIIDFFSHYLQNWDNILHQEQNYLNSLFFKKDGFEKIPSEDYESLLSRIIEYNKDSIEDIILNEIEATDDPIKRRKTYIQAAIWEIIKNTDVNSDNVLILAPISGILQVANNCSKTKYDIEVQTERWASLAQSSLKYVKSQEDYCKYYQECRYQVYDYDCWEYTCLLEAQMTILKYVGYNESNDIEDLDINPDLKLAFKYRFWNFTHIDKTLKANLNDLEVFLISIKSNPFLSHWVRKNYAYYSEGEFAIFKQYIKPDPLMLIERVEFIGRDILSYDEEDLKDYVLQDIKENDVNRCMQFYQEKKKENIDIEIKEKLSNQNELLDTRYYKLEKTTSDNQIYLLFVTIAIIFYFIVWLGKIFF